jgi:hypothetical protein
MYHIYGYMASTTGHRLQRGDSSRCSIQPAKSQRLRFRHPGLDKGVRHRAVARYAEGLTGKHGRRSSKAGEIGGARREQSRLGAVSAPHAEVDQQFARRREHAAHGLGGDQRLEVQDIVMRRDSTSCACGSGAVMRRMGSYLFRCSQPGRWVVVLIDPIGPTRCNRKRTHPSGLWKTAFLCHWIQISAHLQRS